MALTDEDKQWLSDRMQQLETTIEKLQVKIDRVETNLPGFATKEDLERMETNLARFATKEDLERMETNLARFATKEDLERMETNLARFATKEDLAHIREDLGRDLERVETNLLTAFHQWASPMEARQRSHASVMKAFDSELEYMDTRVKKLEGEKAS